MVTPGEERQVLHLRVPLRVLLVPGASSPTASLGQGDTSGAGFAHLLADLEHVRSLGSPRSCPNPTVAK